MVIVKSLKKFFVLVVVLKVSSRADVLNVRQKTNFWVA